MTFNKVRSGKVHIRVTRENLFSDAYNVVMEASPEKLKRAMVIEFKGEEGLDYGGVSR